MKVLIVESDPDLGQLWQRHIARAGTDVVLVGSQDDAVSAIRDQGFSVLILDLVIEGGSALAVADYAGFRRPEMKVIFVTRQSFFSDGSIFNHASNACAMIQPDTSPDDLAAVVEHYGGH